MWTVRFTSGHGDKSQIQKKLRAIGVIGNKHIPQNYLQASVKQRLALLQGLMDTDGSCYTKAGNCEFTSVNKVLAENVLELVSVFWH